jgi:hypothetical protein
MSISLSIFQKTCPGCATSVATSATRCDCGHSFESVANNLSPLEATLRDEELYEGYLSARAEQARQAARAAEDALSVDAGNGDLFSACALAKEVAKSIDNDLVEQRGKIAAMRKALAKLEPVELVVLDPPAAKPSTVAEKSISQPSSAPLAPVRPSPTAAVTPAPLAMKEVLPAATPAKPVSASIWHVATSQKAAGVLSALKNAKAREAIARAQQKLADEAEQASVPANTSTQGAPVPPAFRKVQASRADKIMEARKTTDGKECPNCTSSVPFNTTRCQCGFAFVSGGTELPSLTLCTGDFTALRNSFKLNLR